ncbi:hypothetical protein ACXJY6_07430 [Vibrio sp. RC27]
MKTTKQAGIKPTVGHGATPVMVVYDTDAAPYNPVASKANKINFTK